MRFRQWIILPASLAFGLAIMLSDSVRGDWPTASDDKTESLLVAMSQQIAVIHATYKYSEMGAAAHEALLTMEFGTDRLDVMQMFPLEVAQSQPCVQRFITNGIQTWFAMFRQPNEKKGVVDGAWQIQYYPPGTQADLGPDTSRAAYGVDLVRKALIPYHILHRAEFEPSALPEGYSLNIDQWDGGSASPKHTYRAYRVRKHGEVQNEILYDMDLSDGVRINTTTVSCRMGGRIRPIYILQLDKFEKINDAWIPFRVRETTVDPSLRDYPASEIVFERVDVNPNLPENAFEFIPTNTSLFYDASTRELSYIDYHLEKQSRSEGGTQ